MKTKCNYCEYEWNTKSKMLKVSCPSCGMKVKTGSYKDIIVGDIGNSPVNSDVLKRLINVEKKVEGLDEMIQSLTTNIILRWNR